MPPFPYHTVFVALADRNRQLVSFYRELLGQPPQTEIPGGYAEFQLAGLRLGIFQPKVDHLPEFAAPSSGSMSLCFEVAQLEVAIDRLTAMGYPPPGTITTASHGREIYAYDPAGNRLILHESSPKPLQNTNF
ncbi:VOC family protein [Leptolyngbya ohadii]|uniref:VOC family protein n=1 Tax=Leptolyngbya ohadii TaxID=1962290 RepID=UPI000B599AB0|nr:VOC family protein [Leptolyngbya ohadii]